MLVEAGRLRGRPRAGERDEKTAMRHADSARRLLETGAESLSAVTASVDDQC